MCNRPKIFSVLSMDLGHKLSNIGICTLWVNIENIGTACKSFLPFALFKKQINPSQKCSNTRLRRLFIFTC